MKKLEKKFKSRGYWHEQVARHGRLAIYKRYPVKSETKDHHYEVIKIGKHNGYNLGGSYITPAETYPSSSMWGRCGWTCQDLEAAEDHLEELQKYE